MKTSWWLSLLTVIILALIAPLDQKLTYYLNTQFYGDWVYFFHQSIFQHKKLGFTDFGIFFYLMVIFALIKKRWIDKTQNTELLDKLAFLILSGLIVGVVFIHATKFGLGRARPYLVIDEGFSYSSWYELGSVLSLKNGQSGSFPSGHTATTLWLFALWLLLPFRTMDSFWAKVGSYGFLAIAILQSVVTGISRSVILDHWVTDWVASILVGYLIIVILYKKIVFEKNINWYLPKWSFARYLCGVSILAWLLMGAIYFLRTFL